MSTQKTIFAKIEEFKIFSIDIETYSPDPSENYGLVYSLGKIRLISICTVDSFSVIDLGYNYENLTPTLIEKLKKLCRLLERSDIVKVLHNAMFDLPFLSYFAYKELGLPYLNYSRIIDTLFCCQWIYAGIDRTTGFNNSLSAVALRLLGITLDKTLQKSDFGALELTKEQITYAKDDAVITLKIYDKIKEMYSTTDKQYLSFFVEMCAAIPAFVNMILLGIPCDIELVKSHTQKHLKAMGDLEISFKAKFPKLEITSVSPKVAIAIDEVLPNYKTYYKTSEKTNAILADKDIVLNIAKDSECAELTDYLYAKSLSKRVSNFTQFSECYRDGSVYSTFNLAADSATGRISSARVGGILGSNHQNYPRPYPKDHKLYYCGNVKDCLRAPEGYKMIICDYSSAHARIAAELSQDKNMIKVYREGLDIHCVTAATISPIRKFYGYETPIDWMTGSLMDRYTKIKEAYNNGDVLAEKLRSCSKTMAYLTINFGGSKRLYDTFLGEVPLEECKALLDAYWTTYSDLYAFCNSLQKHTKKVLDPINGAYYATYRMPTGLNRYFRIWSGNYGEQTKINELIASQWLLCEGYSMFKAITRIHAMFLRHSEWEGRLATVNHDEIVSITKDEYSFVAASHVQDIMSDCLGFWIKSFPPIDKVDPSQLICQSWAEK